MVADQHDMVVLRLEEDLSELPVGWRGGRIDFLLHCDELPKREVRQCMRSFIVISIFERRQGQGMPSVTELYKEWVEEVFKSSELPMPLLRTVFRESWTL